MSKCSRCSSNYTKQHHNHIHQQPLNLFLPIMLCSRSSINDIKLSHNHNLHSSSSSTSSPTRIGCTSHARKRSKNKVVFGILTATSSNLNHKLIINPSSDGTKSGSSSSSCKSNHNNVTDSTVKYRKIKQCFFSKSLTTSPNTEAEIISVVPGGGGSSRSRGRQVVERRDSSNNRSSSVNSNSTCNFTSKCVVSGRGTADGSGTIGVVRDLKKQIDIASLDPPLPVVKRRTIPQSVRENGDSGGKYKESSLWKRRSSGPGLRCLQVQSSIHGGAGVVGNDSSEANTV